MRDRATRPKGEGKREAKNEHCVAHGSRRTNIETESEREKGERKEYTKNDCVNR